MRLSDLTRLLPGADVRGDAGSGVSGATADSRAVTPGALYFCVPGASADGHDFAPDAVARGAGALVVERWLALEVPQVRVPSVRAVMGPLSDAVFDHPSRAMTVVGVTGTNGKTTSAFMIEKAFGITGMPTGLIGTVETHIAGEVHPVVHTTPEAPDLQRTLARMRDAGAGAVAMEVSSHGLALGRVAGTWFSCALFTNLTRDHLDFHPTMEDYESAKAMLFDPALSACGAVNADDAAGRRLLARARIPLVSYGIADDAEVRATDVAISRHGSRFVCVTPDERVDVAVRIAGHYNVSNALGALAVFRALGLPLAQAAGGIAALAGVPGRMEAVEAGQPFGVLVDYAHTPDSLENVLRAAREICAGSLIAVFGCGGDRDPGKRPQMGRIGAELADRAIITSDNPRSEDPLAIIAAIEEGARETGRPYEIEPDRRAAIARAFVAARAGDLVVIAGKGHETGQKFADRVLPFDDRIVAREELGRLGAGR